jgi:hypothetical protein
MVARLEKVERQNRRMKGAGIVVRILAVAGLLMGKAFPKDRRVEAEGLVLRDATEKHALSSIRSMARSHFPEPKA